MPTFPKISHDRESLVSALGKKVYRNEFRGKGYQKTWHLPVPRDFPLTTQEIVALYAERMSKDSFPPVD